MYMNVIKYIFIFLVTGVSAQTPTSLTVQKDLRVQGKTVLGGVSKIQDLTIYADTIRMSGLDGTGTFLTIDGSGDVIKGTVGAAGVTGLNHYQPLFGSSTGTIDQDPLWYYDKVNHYMVVGDPTGSAPVPGGEINVTSGTNISNMTASASGASIGVSSGLGQTYMDGLYYRFTDLDGDAFALGRATYSVDEVLLFPAAKGTVNKTLYVSGVSGDDVTLSWGDFTTGTVTSIATTSPITGGTITGTGTIGINNAAADGSTKGAASFTANDFDASSGNISIDYANGQAATSSQDGFLQSSDWSTFNKKTGLVQAPTELTAQTASITTSNVAYATPASDGYYRVTITAAVTTAAATSMDLAVQLRYTEATDNVIKSFPTANVNNYNRTQTNTTGAVVSISAVCHVKASTDIKYYTTFSPVGGSPKYNLHVTIEKLDY